MRLPGGVALGAVGALEVGYEIHSASVAFRLAKRKRCKRLLTAKAKETMRMIGAWLDDVLHLAIGKFDRLRLSEGRLGGGLRECNRQPPKRDEAGRPRPAQWQVAVDRPVFHRGRLMSRWLESVR